MKNNHNKHLLIIGKSEKERHEFVNELMVDSNSVLYRFPANMKKFDQYIEQVRKLFPFIPRNWHEQHPQKWTLHQIWDFHLDWTENTHGILIVIEEFGEMEEEWKVEILRHYLNTSYYQEESNKSRLNFQLIVTQAEEDQLIDKLTAALGLREDEKRTAKQVVEGKLEIVNLDWM